MKYKVLNQLNEEISKELQQYSELTKILLANRDIKTAKDSEVFLNPSYEEHLHNPFLMKDMDKAVERILSAIKNNERIVIYSDYDMDGIPGAVVLHDFFKKINYSNFFNYIPHRNKEGFGLNTAAIDKFGKEDVKLIITIDCGISDIEQVDYANSKNIDVIITDHHLPSQKGLPNSFAILNPKQEKDKYPFKELCGAGVIFKLVQALSFKMELNNGWEKWLLDMVGMATIADMVDLKGENRVLAHYGLKVLQKSPRLGLIKLLRKLKLDQSKIMEDDIGFSIGPRINAASRMDVPEEAFKLLITKDEIEADKLSNHLDNINNSRKGFVASIIKDIRKRSDSFQEKEIIVFGNPDWNPGLVGLACTNLVEEYKKPVFIWGRGEASEIKGSCRSNGHINVFELMNNVSKDVLKSFGGHSMSGGFEIENEKIHLFEESLLRAYDAVEKQDVSENGIIQVDKEMELNEINFENYSQIDKLAPFGEVNPKPIFLFRDILIEETNLFGKTKEHLKLIFRKSNGEEIEAISFFANKNNFFNKVLERKKINLIASIEKSYFMSNGKLRLRIVDIM